MKTKFKSNESVKKTSDTEPIVSKIPAKPLFYMAKTTSRLNVRADKSLSASIVRVLEKGERIKILVEENGWGKLAENEWVKLEFTEKC